MQVPSFPSLPMIDWLQSHLGMSPQLQTRLLVTVGTVVGLWLVRHFVLGFVYRRGAGPRGGDRRRHGGGPPPVAGGGVLLSQNLVVGTTAVPTDPAPAAAGPAR